MTVSNAAWESHFFESAASNAFECGLIQNCDVCRSDAQNGIFGVLCEDSNFAITAADSFLCAQTPMHVFIIVSTFFVMAVCVESLAVFTFRKRQATRAW